MTDTVTRTAYGTPDLTPGGPWAGPAKPPPYVPPVAPGAAAPGPEAPRAAAPGGGSARIRRRLAAGVAAFALVAGGGATGGVLADRYLGAGSAVAAASSASVTTLSEAGTVTSLAAVADAVSPSIVTVLMDRDEGSGVGSGVVLSADGLILTNNHVIASGGTARLRLSDGRTVPATVVAADATHDLALVQGAGLSGLTPATFGTDDSVAVGDTVLAFGSPLGLEGTVTSGIVSAVNRSVESGGSGGSATEQLTGLLQTDAPINSGNSGGALVDTSGRVIGINVAIATAGDNAGSVGLGFAIPADTVATVVGQLRASIS
jgi:putative serine protease PepD